MQSIDSVNDNTKKVRSLTHFSLSDWEDSIKVAEKKMVDELKKRLQYLAD